MHTVSVTTSFTNQSRPIGAYMLCFIGAVAVHLLAAWGAISLQPAGHAIEDRSIEVELFAPDTSDTSDTPDTSDLSEAPIPAPEPAPPEEVAPPEPAVIAKPPESAPAPKPPRRPQTATSPSIKTAPKRGSSGTGSERTSPGTGLGATTASYLSNPHPPYPGESIRLREEGAVMLTVHVTREGRVSSLSLQRSSGFPRLDAAAMEGVRRWRFKPSISDGIPKADTVSVPVRFKLK